MSLRAVAIASDHRGIALKAVLSESMRARGLKVVDLGPESEQAVDYPDFAIELANLVGSGRCERGIFVDGAGIGGAMAANKVPGVRAAHCRDAFEIRNSRTHNDANLLTLGSRSGEENDLLELVRLWLQLPFEGGRHARRVDKINVLDRRR